MNHSLRRGLYLLAAIFVTLLAACLTYWDSSGRSSLFWWARLFGLAAMWMGAFAWWKQWRNSSQCPAPPADLNRQVFIACLQTITTLFFLSLALLADFRTRINSFVDYHSSSETWWIASGVWLVGTAWLWWLVLRTDQEAERE